MPDAHAKRAGSDFSLLHELSGAHPLRARFFARARRKKAGHECPAFSNLSLTSAAGNLPKAARLKIGERLIDLLVRVHHERAIPRYGFA